jgi:hypothetical protein
MILHPGPLFVYGLIKRQRSSLMFDSCCLMLSNYIQPGVIRIGISKDNTMPKRKRTNNDLQNNTQKTNDRATRTPLKTQAGRRCSGRVSSSRSTSDTRRVKRYEHYLTWKSCWTSQHGTKNVKTCNLTTLNNKNQTLNWISAFLSKSSWRLSQSFWDLIVL